jgi:hypothetical protein
MASLMTSDDLPHQENVHSDLTRPTAATEMGLTQGLTPMATEAVLTNLETNLERVLATLGGGIGTLITASALITALLVTWRLRRKGAVMGAPHGAHRRPRLPVRPLGGRVRVAVVEPDDIIE